MPSRAKTQPRPVRNFAIKEKKTRNGADEGVVRTRQKAVTAKADAT